MSGALPNLLEWACFRWREEVQDRPLENVHRRTLDDAWRQVIRFAGGDPDALVGPSHDVRCAQTPPKMSAPSIQDLLDALAHKPESQCYVQQLAEAITNIQVSARRVGMSKISFVSNQLSPSEFMANTGKVGFVVWVARDRLS